jgi:geranylgeranyl reductase family protein
MKKFDVAIVGAGPSGSSAAIALARKGYSVALLEKEQFPREKICGDFLNPANWPVLRQLDVEREVLSCPHEKVTTFRLTSFSGEEAQVPLPGRNGAMVFGLGLRRFDLDHVLITQAEQKGATVLQGCRFKELRRESDDWVLVCERSGTIDRFRARILIGADGRNSRVAHHLGMTGGAGRQGRSVGFQVHLKCSAGVAGKIEIHLFPGGYAGLVRLNRDTVTLGLAVDKARLPDQGRTQFLLNHCLPQNPWLREIARAKHMGEVRSAYPVSFAPRRVFDEGVLLVGDAARVNEPVTGEGVYFAMKSGLLAADVIDRAFEKTDFSVAHLSAYAREWRRAFRLRTGMNSLIHWLIYRPALLSPFIRLSAKKGRVLNSIVQAVCLPEAAR